MQVRALSQAVRNDTFADSLDALGDIGARLKARAQTIGATLDHDSVVAAIDADQGELGDDLSARALHILAAGRCAEHWGCSVRKPPRSGK